jgi:pyridoxal biosynthesis lyase PdxS
MAETKAEKAAATGKDSASPAQGKVIVSLPKDVADDIDTIICNLDEAQAELAKEVEARFGVAPPVQSLTRSQVVKIAVGDLLTKQDAALDSALGSDDATGEE